MPGFPGETPTRAQEIVMSNTKTLGPTAVNEFRVSFFRTATITNKPEGSFASLSSLGFRDRPRNTGHYPFGTRRVPANCAADILQRLFDRREHADYQPAQ